MKIPAEFGAMDINTLCKKLSMSRSFFYGLQAKGLGPKTIRVASKVLITNEAARQWLAGFEDKSNAA